jgi:DNA-binding transcriptional ArsR family regulator
MTMVEIRGVSVAAPRPSVMSCAVMPQRAKSSPADRVFAALANPTRRDVLDLLLDGPRPVQDIAERFDMARPSVSEHLKVLRDAGLVTETRHGRQRHYAVRPEPLRDLQRWLSPYERFWRGKLGDLREFLDARDDARDDAEVDQ